MDVVVQKYGGTSVNKPQLREMIVQNLAHAKEKGLYPVVVVSAMGRRGEAYATDTLLELVNNSADMDERSRDLLVSCGEIISCVIVAEDIKKAGYKVMPLTGIQAGIKTNGIYGASDIIDIDTSIILKLLQQDIVPVVAGFQGQGKGFEITTLGRGGSDITATALGSYLNAESVEIYTDVDGVMTADPKVVDNAHIIEKIDYEEVFQLAEFGAKVIHPRAIEYAQRGNVPVVVLNTSKGRDRGGTIISKISKNWSDDKVFTAITSKDKQVQIKRKGGAENENLF
jgi:aspartate kinase